ncbi:hypothetical protein KC614_01470, partial [candidate division WWE3 bacterium]|nr:hypothetical protein [candidate division WWE3 bacterium]
MTESTTPPPSAGKTILGALTPIFFVVVALILAASYGLVADLMGNHLYAMMVYVGVVIALLAVMMAVKQPVWAWVAFGVVFFGVLFWSNPNLVGLVVFDLKTSLAQLVVA